MKNSPRSYEALRFTSTVIIALGWLVIIVGWGIAFLIGAIYFEAFYQTLVSFGLPENISGILANSLTAFWGLVSTIYGVFVIAGGQIIMVLLDIRDNTYTTAQIMRKQN